jgi:hypothetical protein
LGIQESFKELVKHKAQQMAEASTWKEQAAELGLKSDDELKAFKLGGWDAMIFDMAQALNFVSYARRDFRQRLIEKWLREGM